MKKYFQISIISVFIILLLSAWSSLAYADDPKAFAKYNRVTKFDRHFKKYTKRFFGPFFDWRHFKAQAIAESNLNPEAKSKVGAEGIMQIMPRTYVEIRKKQTSIKGSRKQPKWCIAAGIYYNRLIWKTWKAKRPFQDRLDFMFGSYNAGKGNILKAQKIAEKMNLNPNLWKSIRPTLPKVTGKNSIETINYVDRINGIKGVLK